MSIRSIILTLTLALPAAALLLFGPRGLIQAPPDRLVVHYWEKWAGVEGKAIRALVDRFNQTEGRERGLWVEYNEISNIEQRLLIAIAGGDPPDVAGIIDSRIPQFAEQNALIPLDDLVRTHNVNLENLKPVWANLCRYDGKLYGLPSTPFTIALYYNRARFREAGLDPDRPPQTTSELSDYAKRLTRFDASGRITHLGLTTSTSMLGWWPWVWPNYFDGRLWDGQRYALDSPPGRAAAQWIWDMRESIGSSAMLEFEGREMPIEGAGNAFLSGQLAMVYQGPWVANWIRTYAPQLDYAVAPFPSSTPERHHAFASADVFVIPRGSKHPDAAMTFVAWIQRQENLEELCKAHGKVSPFREPSPAFFDGHPNPWVRVFDSLASSPDAFGFPHMPMWTQMEDEAKSFMQTIVRGDLPVDAAIRRSQARIDAFVGEYQRMAGLRLSEEAR